MPQIVFILALFSFTFGRSQENSDTSNRFISNELPLTIGQAENPENHQETSQLKTMDKELKKLYDEFIAEGFNQFYIEGIGGPTSDGIEILGQTNGNWEVCYVENGKKDKPIFSSIHKKEAITFYRNHVSKIKHPHLVAFTRSQVKIEAIKKNLNAHKIEYWQNDIPNYQEVGDTVYRIFVFNKDIFKLKEIDVDMPFIEVLK